VIWGEMTCQLDTWHDAYLTWMTGNGYGASIRGDGRWYLPMHPLPSASESVEDNARNAILLRNALNERKEFHVIIEYTFKVTNRSANTTAKQIVQPKNLLPLALTYCVALTHSATTRASSSAAVSTP
jgi:hypothetical protein